MNKRSKQVSQVSLLCRKKAQQEMVGFILIILLVVIISLVFLGIWLRSPGEGNESERVYSLIDTIMSYTTGCAIVYEPDYDSVSDLIIHAKEGKRCSNLGVSCEDYLNMTLRSIMKDLIATEASISGYEVDIYTGEEGVRQGEVLYFGEGNVSGGGAYGVDMIRSRNENIYFKLKLYS